MQKVFNLVNKYIVLATPLILYSLVSSIYMLSTVNGKFINLFFAVLLFTLMTAAFMAGWFKMIKIAISETEKNEPNSLIQEFVGGVGEYFLASLGAIFVILVVSTSILAISYFIGMNTIGDVGISAQTLSEVIKDQTALKGFVENLSKEQLIKLNLWNLLVLASMTISYLLHFLYLPALFFKNKNPLIAFGISLKNLFSKKIFHTIGIFLLIFIVNFVISILATIFGGNIIMHFIITLLNFYFITVVCVGIFYYYYNNFVVSLIGKNVDIEI